MAALRLRTGLVLKSFPALARSQQNRSFALSRSLGLPPKAETQKVALLGDRIDIPGTNNVSLKEDASAKIHDFTAFRQFMMADPTNQWRGRAFMLTIASQIQVEAANAGHYAMAREKRLELEQKMLQTRIPEVKEFAIVDTNFVYPSAPDGKETFVITEPSNMVGHIRMNIDAVVKDAKAPPRTGSFFMGYGFLFGKELYYNEPGTQLGAYLKYLEGALVNLGSCDTERDLVHPDIYEKKSYFDMHNARGPNGELSMNEQKAAFLKQLQAKVGGGLTFFNSYHSQSCSSAFWDTATALKAGLLVDCWALSPPPCLNQWSHILMPKVAACIRNVFPANDAVPYMADALSILAAIKNSAVATMLTSGKPIPNLNWKGVPTTPVGSYSIIPRLIGTFVRPGALDYILPAAPGHPLYAHKLVHALTHTGGIYPQYTPGQTTRQKLIALFTPKVAITED